MKLEDQYKYLIGAYYGVMEMDEYSLKVYILRDIENYIKDFISVNPIPNYSYRVEAEKFEKELSLKTKLQDILEEIQKNMYAECEKRVKDRTTVAYNLDEFSKNLEKNQGYVKTMWCGSEECEDKIHELTGAKSRCIPFKQEHIADTCVCCGKPADKMVIWGRQY